MWAPFESSAIIPRVFDISRSVLLALSVRVSQTQIFLQVGTLLCCLDFSVSRKFSMRSMSTNMCFTMLSLFCALLFTFVAADDNTHTYAANEAVTLWVNTIGPFHNPTEIYAYYGTCSMSSLRRHPLHCQGHPFSSL